MVNKKKNMAKPKVEKPIKKVKSFNLDDKIYINLMGLLETSGTQVTLSALVDDFLRKLYVYLVEAEGVIKKRKSGMGLGDVLYNCMNIEYFRESNKDDNRILNLIYSHEAFKEGMSLHEYLARTTPPWEQ
jgi:hypothetical protein